MIFKTTIHLNQKLGFFLSISHSTFVAMAAGVVVFFSPTSCFSAKLLDHTTVIVNYLQSVEIDESAYSGIDGVDAIYLINLDARTEKYATCQSIFQKLGLSVNRFSAVNGWKLNLDIKALFGGNPPLFRGPAPWTLGQIGCLLSHLSVIQDGYNRGFECIWIMEDDIQYGGNLDRLSPILKKLQILDPNWDIFYTDKQSAWCMDSYARPDEVDQLSYFRSKGWECIDDEIETSGFRYGAHSWLLSRAGMKKLIDYFTHVYLYTPIDVDTHFIPTIREYGYRAVHGPIMTHDTSKTSDTEFNYSSSN